MSGLRDIALAAGAAAVFGGGIVAALDWSAATAMFPTVIGVAGLGLAIWAIAADIAKRNRADAAEPALSAADTARARGSFLWIAVFFAAVLLIGFEVGFAAAALAFYRIEARLGWVAASGIAVVCGGFLYAAAHVLNIPLYAGLLPDLFL
jgi:hypothetical protein